MSYYEKYFGDTKWKLKASESQKLQKEEDLIGAYALIAILNTCILIPSIFGFLIFDSKVFLFFVFTFATFATFFWLIYYKTSRNYNKVLSEIKKRLTEQKEE